MVEEPHVVITSTTLGAPAPVFPLARQAALPIKSRSWSYRLRAAATPRGRQVGEPRRHLRRRIGWCRTAGHRSRPGAPIGSSAEAASGLLVVAWRS